MGMIKLIDNKTSIVIGVNGQDGYFLSRIIKLLGSPCFGVGLQDKANKYVDPFLDEYFQINLASKESVIKLSSILNKNECKYIYYCAALHGPSQIMGHLNMNNMQSINRDAFILLINRLTYQPSKVVFFSSSLVYGKNLNGIISDSTEVVPSCIYSKLKVDVENYCRNLEIFQLNKLSIVRLFNHESIFRKQGFLFTKILDRLALPYDEEGLLSFAYEIDFMNDWGSAEYFMNFLVKNIDNLPRIFNLASGTQSNTGLEFILAAEKIFNKKISIMKPFNNLSPKFMVKMGPLNKKFAHYDHPSFREIIISEFNKIK
jgi:GDP-D-mannose dehydratase